jgi:hypothetical protein
MSHHSPPEHRSTIAEHEVFNLDRYEQVRGCAGPGEDRRQAGPYQVRIRPRLERIVEDDDREDAFRFIRDVLEEKVKANELPHCVPFYDAGYNPGQADNFKKGS